MSYNNVTFSFALINLVLTCINCSRYYNPTFINYYVVEIVRHHCMEVSGYVSRESCTHSTRIL